MKYITIADLSETIRKNLWKIPHDIDFIIGVHRSGMIAASMIASYLNVPLIDVNSYLSGIAPYGGNRLEYFTESHKSSGKILVVDDTVYSGSTLNHVKQSIIGSHKAGEYIYMCVYLEGRNPRILPDFYLEDISAFTNKDNPIVYYEWNLIQHGTYLTASALFDMDGVLCSNPPDERNEEEYINFIKNAPPLFTPLTVIGGIVTYRLSKNMEITRDWLKRNNIHYNTLTMFDANSWDERNDRGISPEQFKANIYANNQRYKIFIESDDNQAVNICKLSRKPVFSIEKNKLYQNL